MHFSGARVDRNIAKQRGEEGAPSVALMNRENEAENSNLGNGSPGRGYRERSVRSEVKDLCCEITKLLRLTAGRLRNGCYLLCRSGLLALDAMFINC